MRGWEGWASVAASEREAAWRDLGLIEDPTVPDTAAWRRNAAQKAMVAAIVESDLWPPGPSLAQQQAAITAAYARSDAADPYADLTPAERDAAVHASWGLHAPDLDAEAS